jgi:hypothetical protein
LFYAWLSLCSLKMQIWNYLNASLIFSGGYDQNKDPQCFMCSQVLDGLKMICFYS